MIEATAPSNVVGFDCEHTSDEPMAAQAVHDLCIAYPGHDWFVIVKGGVMHVKSMRVSDKWGMCLHYSQIKGDANDRKAQIVRGAGEFLERANLRRGKAEERPVLQLEGIPDKHLVRNGIGT